MKKIFQENVLSTHVKPIYHLQLQIFWHARRDIGNLTRSPVENRGYFKSQKYSGRKECGRTSLKRLKERKGQRDSKTRYSQTYLHLPNEALIPQSGRTALALCVLSHDLYSLKLEEKIYGTYSLFDEEILHRLFSSFCKQYLRAYTTLNDSCPEAISSISGPTFKRAFRTRRNDGTPQGESPSPCRIKEQPLTRGYEGLRDACCTHECASLESRSAINDLTVPYAAPFTEQKRTTDDGPATNCACRCPVTSYLKTQRQRSPSGQVKVSLELFFSFCSININAETKDLWDSHAESLIL